jgi:hypothetical protein
MIEFPRSALIAIATGLPLLAGGAAAADDQQTVYVRTDLVSNTQNLVQPKDPNLQNAWGVANAPGGALWVSDNNDGLSTLYDGNGVKQGLVVTIPLPPGRVAPPAAAPTGLVWNPTTGFTFTVGGTTVPAVFIFDSEDGTIVAWNPAVDPIAAGQSTATVVVNNSAKGAVYKGLVRHQHAWQFPVRDKFCSGHGRSLRQNLCARDARRKLQRSEYPRRLRTIRHRQYR